jgi:hypothetical protein
MEGLYVAGDCDECDLPEEDVPVLYLKAEPTWALDSRSHRVTMPVKGQRTKAERVAAEVVVVAALEQKKRLEMVQAWVSIHITFPRISNLSPWRLANRPHFYIYMEGPTLFIKRNKRAKYTPPDQKADSAPAQPNRLPILRSTQFRETMATFHLVDNMISVEGGFDHTIYKIRSRGVKFIYEYYNTREALKTLALGLVQAQKGGRAENSPLVALVQSPMFEPKLLGGISALIP